MALDSGPELDGGAEKAGQSQRRVRTDAGSAPADFVDAHGRNANILGQSVLADAHRLQKFLKEDFAGMYGGKISHCNASVIVDDFDGIGATLMPFKTDKDSIVKVYYVH